MVCQQRQMTWSPAGCGPPPTSTHPGRAAAPRRRRYHRHPAGPQARPYRRYRRCRSAQRAAGRAGIQSFGYLVGDLNSAAQARKAVGTGVRKKTPEPDSAEAPAAAAAPEEQVQPQRRRRPKIKQLGRGYEYLDLDPETGHDPTGSPQGAGTLGFAGTTHKASPGQVAGLITLPNDAFGGSPRTPMMPGTWDTDSATRVE